MNVSFEKLSDAQLVQLSSSNVRAFWFLVDKYEKKLYRYVYKYIQDAMDVQDITQEVFIQVYKNLYSYDEKLSFSSWIYRIAHNKVIDFLRKQKNKNIFSIEEKDEEHITSLFEFLSDTNSPEIFLQKQENIWEIQRALKEIPEKYSSVLVLYFFEERSYDQISDILKIPQGTVSVRINRGKKILQKKLKIIY